MGTRGKGGKRRELGAISAPAVISKMAFDLYNFPDDHIGSKRYVHVRGHSRSVPIPYTYKGNDGFNYVRPEYGGTYEGVSGRSELADTLCMNFVPDISGFVSPIDGAFISSRSQRDVHLKAHGVVEVGNEKWGERQERAPMQRAGLDVKRAMEELGSR